MRKALFKWHSIAALVAMLPILIISVTGSILVFKVEIDSWLRPEHMRVDAAPQAARASLDGIMQQVLQEHPDYELGGWELFDDHQRSDAAYLIKRGTDDWFKVYVDQYRARLLSVPQPMDHYLTDWLLELHYTFLLHVKGATAALVTAIIMTFLGVSGIVLYRRFWAKLLTFRFAAAWRILLSDLHKFIGIISSPVMLVIALTGAYWTLMGILHEIDEHSDAEHSYIQHPRHAPEISFQALMEQATHAINSFRPGYLSMPHEPGRDITFYGAVDGNNPFNSEYASTVTFDRLSGELLRTTDIRQASTLRVFIDSFRKLHFGYFAGITSRVIWCLLGFAPVLLALSGLAMYLLRRRRQPQTRATAMRRQRA